MTDEPQFEQARLELSREWAAKPPGWAPYLVRNNPPPMPLALRDEMGALEHRSAVIRNRVPFERGVVSLFAVSAVSVALPAALVAWAWWRLRRTPDRRWAAGLCAGCGYDLRGSPGRCPECGRSTAEPPTLDVPPAGSG